MGGLPRPPPLPSVGVSVGGRAELAAGGDGRLVEIVAAARRRRPSPGTLTVVVPPMAIVPPMVPLAPVPRRTVTVLVPAVYSP